MLTHHGTVAAALGIHGSTAVMIAISGLLILWETRKPADVSVPASDALTV